MVTFPSAYTANFNTGFNVVESVAAAPPDWWNWAEVAAARLRASRRVPVSNRAKGRQGGSCRALYVDMDALCVTQYAEGQSAGLSCHAEV